MAVFVRAKRCHTKAVAVWEGGVYRTEWHFNSDPKNSNSNLIQYWGEKCVQKLLSTAIYGDQICA